MLVVAFVAFVECSRFFFLLHKAFITEMFERGIPRDAFFYCRGLKTEHKKTVNYAANVLAADILYNIVNNVPRYGIRPPASGYLYAAQVGKFATQYTIPASFIEKKKLKKKRDEIFVVVWITLDVISVL
jgi:hypothetical protein